MQTRRGRGTCRGAPSVVESHREREREGAPLKIGILDSGIGGLSVLHGALRRWPRAEYLFYADRAHVPYGEKTPEAVRGFVEEIIRYLVAEGCGAVVIACNTATSVAAAAMREKFSLPILGMEPAVKLALDRYDRGRVLAAATPITVHGEKLERLLERFDGEGRTDLLALPELVTFAERGEFTGENVTAYLRKELEPFAPEDYCAFVLGCTHFNFFKDTLRALLPENVHLLDGVDGVLRHLAESVPMPEGEGEGRVRFVSSGAEAGAAELDFFRACLRRLDAMAEIE